MDVYNIEIHFNDIEKLAKIGYEYFAIEKMSKAVSDLKEIKILATVLIEELERR